MTNRNIGVTQDTNFWVKIEAQDGGYIKSQSVEVNLLLLILRELRKRKEG